MTLYEEMVANGYVNPVQQNNPSQGSKPSLYDEMVASGYAEHALNQPQIEDSFRASVQDEQQPGFFQGAIQGMAKPVLESAVSVTKPIQASYQLMRGDTAGAQHTLDTPSDFGYLGKSIKPMGNLTPEQASTAEGVERIVRDAGGNALQLAPYTFGAGFMKPGMSLGGRILAGAEGGALTGGMSSAGSAIKNDKGLVDTLGRAAVGALGGGVVGGTVPLLGAGIRKGYSALTGIRDEALKNATQNPGALDYGIKAVRENPKEPFYGLTKELGVKLNSDKVSGSDAWVSAARAFQKNNPNARFSVAPTVIEATKLLKGFGIKTSVKNGEITLRAPELSGFSDKEVEVIQIWLNKLARSTNLTAEELPMARQAFTKYYNAIKVPDTGPTPFHAAMMQMKKPLNDVLDSVIPDDLKAADGMIKAWYDAMDDYGSRVISGDGELKQGAESFLGTLANQNKGVLRDKVGQGLVNRVQSIKDAQYMQNLLPPTGGRMGDVMRAWASRGLGVSSGSGAFFNPAAAALGGFATANMSPAIVGNVARGIGKLGEAGVTGALKTGILEGVSEPTGKALLTQARKRILGK